MNEPKLSHSSLITGLMKKYAQNGDALAGLEWALPRVLHAILAEAGSLFLHRPNEKTLECVICNGPVDLVGLKVLETKGLVGKTYQTGIPELIEDTSKNNSHDNTTDLATGFKTISVATSPVCIGEKRFGVIQVINKKVDGVVKSFSQSDLMLLESLASALALALLNVDLSEQIISDKILERDLNQAIEAQNLLLPKFNVNGYAAGQVLTARNLSGDFFDYIHVENKLAFCEGDVAGKGITASLLMARTVALFRNLAKRGLSAQQIAMTINSEFLEVSSERFVTFACGWMDCATGEVEFVNCGHGTVLFLDPTKGENSQYHSQTIPLGIRPFNSDELVPIKINLVNKYLLLATDGVTEAKFKGQELGLEGLIELALRLEGQTVSEKVVNLIKLFKKGMLSTHDDATILILSCPQLKI